jgi:hypothetical protein
MNDKCVCNFAVVRFLPYPETGEFVNIGIVMACPQTGLFDYRIETKQRGRITGFFPELDAAVLLDGRRAFIAEIKRLKDALNRHARPDQQAFDFDRKDLVAIFRELVKPRESVFRFSEIGTVLARKPDRALQDLFEYYVKRQFAQHNEYHETIMTRRLTRVFRAEHIVEYRQRKFGNDLYHVTLPFVKEQGGRAVRAIRPLDLDKQDSTRIIEYGDKWKLRVERLREMQDFPERMLFVVRQPESGKRRQAADAAREELDRLEVQTVSEADRAELVEFAKAS